MDKYLRSSKTEIIKQIADYFSIENITTEDIFNTNNIPKYQEFDSYKSFFLKIIDYNTENQTVTSEQISIIVLKNTVITFQEKSTGLFDPLRDRIKNKKGRIKKKGKDYLVFAILDIIIDRYLFATTQIGQDIENTSKKIFDIQEKKFEQKLYNLKTEIGFLKMQIRPVNEIILKALLSETSFIENSTKSFLNNLSELTTQANDTIELYNIIIVDQINSYNTLVGSKMNQIMTILTIFATIFIPLTFISGVYGMNFEFMPEKNYSYSYLIF